MTMVGWSERIQPRHRGASLCRCVVAFGATVVPRQRHPCQRCALSCPPSPQVWRGAHEQRLRDAPLLRDAKYMSRELRTAAWRRGRPQNREEKPPPLFDEKMMRGAERGRAGWDVARWALWMMGIEESETRFCTWECACVLAAVAAQCHMAELLSSTTRVCSVFAPSPSDHHRASSGHPATAQRAGIQGEQPLCSAHECQRRGSSH